MALDALVTNPGRLRILTSLAAEPTQEFVRLRERTRLTDGNLSTHARRLQNAGLLAIDKAFRAGKPVTTITLTAQGRNALESHVRDLMQAMNPAATDQPVSVSMQADAQDDWVD
ncbi:MAG TPA: transcriptional regulator [Tepidisphaeraceae bacterium]|jgi:DNA-binding MarR family transcriptional regulator|nr:transcriptional regulator [Tepidisphaeraceae bacterium]